MPEKVNRKPIGNFFIKKSLQLRLIFKIVLAALTSTLVTSGCLILVYYLKYKTVVVYQLDKLSQELTREHIVFLILPTVLISSLVSLLFSFGVGLYASRKYAVPIYKLEQWAALLRQGKLTARLSFREKEEMKELSDECNQLAMGIRDRFIEVRRQTELLKQTVASSEISVELEKILSSLELEAVPIEVNTTFCTVSRQKEVHD